MIRAGAGAAALAIAAAVVLAGCAAPRAVGTRLREIARIAEEGRARGAYRCAPEELALATAHLEFAQLELAQGDVVRAREHLVIADANARAAVRLSAQPGCEGGDDRAPEARRAARSRHVYQARVPARAPKRAEAPALRRPSGPLRAAHPRSTHGHVRS